MSTTKALLLWLLLGRAIGLVSVRKPSRNRPLLGSATTESAGDGVMKESADADSLGCPFSSSCPRYRIDITSMKKEDKGLSVPFVSKFMAKAQVEKEFGRSSQVDWCENLDGISAFSRLWRDATTSNTQSVVLAFPDCDKRVLFNWVEMMDWIQARGLGDVSAKFLGDAPVPSVQLSRQRASTSVQEARYNPSTVETRMKSWVKRLLVEKRICPFTKSVEKSGHGLAELDVPVASIAYHCSDAPTDDIYQLMADSWAAIDDMIQRGPSGKDGVSSILLAAPNFDDRFDLWSGPVFCLFETGVVAAQAEAQVGVVCFHPEYKTPDGTSWPGFGHMHSIPRLKSWIEDEREGVCVFSDNEVAAGGAWQRRTPHATLNVLRADQLERAESKRNTPKLYTRNIETLMEIGNEKLREDLETERRFE